MPMTPPLRSLKQKDQKLKNNEDYIEFRGQDPHRGRQEPTPTSCSLVCINTHIYHIHS